MTKKILNVRFDEETYRKFKQYCKEQERSMAAQIRKLVKEQLLFVELVNKNSEKSGKGFANFVKKSL